MHKRLFFSLTSLKESFLSYRGEFGESVECGLFMHEGKKDSVNKMSAHEQLELYVVLLYNKLVLTRVTSFALIFAYTFQPRCFYLGFDFQKSLS